MGLLFSLFLLTRVRSGRFFSTHSFSFFSALLLILSYNCFSLELILLNSFLMFSLTSVELKCSLEVIRMLQICMMSLSFQVFCPKKKKKNYALCFQRKICAFVLEVSSR